MRTFFVLALAALLPALARADAFTDFRIPRHRVYSADGNLSGRWVGMDGNSRNPTHSQGARQSEGEGTLSGSGAWLRDSDPLRLYLYSNARLEGEQSRARDTWAPLNTSVFRQNNYDFERLTESWQLGGAVRAYPWQPPLGLELSASLTGNHYQSWQEYFVRDGSAAAVNRTRETRRNSGNGYNAWGGVTFGYGRVRDASAVYDIYALEQRLLALGVLTRELLPATRQRLIDLFYLDGDYSTVHDRPARFFWREVEDALNADGGLGATGLDAYSLIRIAEPYIGSYDYADYYAGAYAGVNPAARAPRPVPYVGSPAGSSLYRPVGFFVGPTVWATHQNVGEWRDYRRTVTSTDTTVAVPLPVTSSVHDRSFYDLVYFGLRGEYHRPFGYRGQLDLRSEVRVPWEDHHRYKRVSFDSDINGTLGYIVADRWLAQAHVSHERVLQVYREPGGEWFTGSVWGTQAQVSATYFIEDRLALTLAVRQSQGSSDRSYDSPPVSPVYNGTERGFSRTHEATIGLSYRFTGRLEAPGVAARSSIHN